MASERDYYQILQISPKADPAIVKAAYYTHLKTLKKHPDLGGNHGEATLLNEAYEILSDPQSRREYDKQFLKGLASEASAPEPNPFVPDHENRRAPRVCFQNHFRFKRKSNSHWFDSQFRDLSLSGACFRSQEKFKEEEALELDISDNPLVQIQAKVRWVRIIPQRFGGGLYEGGVAFKKVDDKNFRRYLKLVGLEKLLTLDL